MRRPTGDILSVVLVVLSGCATNTVKFEEVAADGTYTTFKMDSNALWKTEQVSDNMVSYEGAGWKLQAGASGAQQAGDMTELLTGIMSMMAPVLQDYVNRPRLPDSPDAMDRLTDAVADRIRSEGNAEGLR